MKQHSLNTVHIEIDNGTHELDNVIQIINGGIQRVYRSMIQVFVKGSDKAVELYKKAFDAELVSSYPHSDGTFKHAELNVYGQILAISEALENEERITGTTMQFCLHFGKDKEEIVQKAYDTLKDDAKILCPLGPCNFSALMVDLIDKYGVRWCIFA